MEWVYYCLQCSDKGIKIDILIGDIMSFNEWKEKYNIDLSKYHGNIGDLEGNICIEDADGKGWTFWNSKGQFEKVQI